MLKSAGARRLRKTLRRCPAGAQIAQRIASWTWDVTHERALSPADLFELELELIQTQMAQKPMLRAEVYARALRASQNRIEDIV